MRPKKSLNNMLKKIRLFSQTSIFALAISATNAFGIDLIKYDAEPEVLSDPYRQQGLVSLEGSYVGIRAGTDSTAPMTVFNAETGEIVAGDIFDADSPRIIEYSTQTGWAVVRDETGTLKLMKPNDSSASVMEIAPGRAVNLTQFVGENRDMLLVISADGTEDSDVSRKIEAINLSDLQTAWEKQFDEITTLTISFDRTRLIVATYQDDQIYIETLDTYALGTGDLYQTTDLTELNLLTTNSPLNRLVHSSTGRLTFIYSNILSLERFLYVLDNDTGIYDEHTFSVPIELSDDEEVYIATNPDNEVEVRSSETGDTIYTFPSNTERDPVFSSSDDSILFRQTSSTTIQEVDFSTETILETYTLPEGADAIKAFFASNSGSAIAATTENDKLVVFDLQSDSTVTIDLPFTSPANGGFSPDGNHILLSHSSGQIISLPVSEPAQYVQLAKGRIEIVKYSETNDKLLTLRGSGKIHLVDPESSESTLAASIPLESNQGIIDVSADSLRTIVYNANGNIEIYDPVSESVVYESNLTASSGAFYRGAISPDGNCLAYSIRLSPGQASSETRLVIYDLDSDSLTAEIESTSLDFDAFIFAPDSQTLYLAGETGITIIDPIDGSVMGSIDSLAENAVFNISPDSSLLTVASAGSLLSFDPETGASIQSISFESDSQASPTAVAVSHDNSLALVISGDNLATIIDLQASATISEKKVFWIQDDSFNESATPAPVFLPDTRSFVSYYFGGAATKWDFKKAIGLPSNLALGSTDGTLDLSSEEGTIHLVESSIDLEEWENLVELDPFLNETPESVEVPAPSSLDSRFFRVWTYE